MSTVLLVDDEPGVLFTLREVLTERGHRVVTRALAARGARPSSTSADAVVTDLAMPGMDGLELMSADRASAIRRCR